MHPLALQRTSWLYIQRLCYLWYFKSCFWCFACKRQQYRWYRGQSSTSAAPVAAVTTSNTLACSPEETVNTASVFALTDNLCPHALQLLRCRSWCPPETSAAPRTAQSSPSEDAPPSRNRPCSRRENRKESRARSGAPSPATHRARLGPYPPSSHMTGPIRQQGEAVCESVCGGLNLWSVTLYPAVFGLEIFFFLKTGQPANVETRESVFLLLTLQEQRNRFWRSSQAGGNLTCSPLLLLQGNSPSLWKTH